jgi:hypothetical protein
MGGILDGMTKIKKQYGEKTRSVLFFLFLCDKMNLQEYKNVKGDSKSEE